MKKFLSALLLTLVVSSIVSACTEDNVTPKDGGNGSSDTCTSAGCT